MPLLNRAAQFAAFSALKSYEEAVAETSRLTIERIELDEDEKAALNEILREIQDNLDKQVMIEFTSYVPDARKSGGVYQTQTGVVKKLIRYEAC